MRISCIGGGPAGLYLGILVKRLAPDHQVVVFERNRPDDTFGFGVVFSDATLGHLQPPLDPGQQYEITQLIAAGAPPEIAWPPVPRSILGEDLGGLEPRGATRRQKPTEHTEQRRAGERERDHPPAEVEVGVGLEREARQVVQ